MGPGQPPGAPRDFFGDDLNLHYCALVDTVKTTIHEGDQVQGQLTMAAGEIVELLNTHIAEGWSWVRSSSGAEGYVPEGYLESA